VKTPTRRVNIETAKELNQEEINEIFLRSELYLRGFDYLEIYEEL